MNEQSITVNGREIAAELPSSIEQFVLSQKLPPRSVVVELNGEAVPPSQFAHRMLQPVDKLEIVKVVAGG